MSDIKFTAEASRTASDTLAKKSTSSDVVSGGHLVAKALKNEGVDTIFTLCGGHIIDIYDGCIDEGIRIIDVRHEQTAAHAADGYARQTGRLGCVVTTAGPGCAPDGPSVDFGWYGQWEKHPRACKVRPRVALAAA